jgi:hypothetical protein
MSRKHFIALAAIVAEAPGTTTESAWLAERIIAVCQTENPRFRRDTFLRACGLGHLAAN